MMKRLCAITVAVAVVMSLLMTEVSVAAADSYAGSSPNDYQQYVQEKQSCPFDASVKVDIAAYTCSEDAEVSMQTMDGAPALMTGDIGTVTWTFSVEQTGLYDLRVTYHTVEGKGSSIERMLLLDGKVPYREAQDLLFTRCWVNVGDKIYTRSGNEYRRPQEEVYQWMDSLLYSSIGYQDDSLKLYLEQGEHTLSFTAVAEPMAIGGLVFEAEPALPTYAEVQTGYRNAGYRAAEATQRWEAEDASRWSDATLYAIEDRTSPANSPFDESLILLNTIGGNAWKFGRQWIEWDIHVPADGLYALTLRTKQNFVSGASASRRLYIDGKVPFAEANALTVDYRLQWQVVTFGDDDGVPYEFYLSAGDHTLRLEVVNGAIADILYAINQSVQDLNLTYRKIKMIVGSFPDPLRDYELEENIPGLFDSMEETIDQLEASRGDIVRLTGQEGEQTSYIDKLVLQLRSMIRYPDSIPERLSDMSDNINTLSTWLASASQVPLLIDYMMLAPADQDPPPADLNFFVRLFHSIKGFFLSFVNDYNAIESLNDAETITDEITLWLGIGRDQSLIIKNLADSQFTAQSRVGVHIKLVDMSILLQAVSSGNGPDVALFLDQAMPLNYGVRGALYDLNSFEDAPQVLDAFDESAITPFRLDDALYALPEQQTFPMLFYRTDVFEELGLTAPDTWNDLYKLIPVLQENNMEIGLPSPLTVASGSQSTGLNRIFTALLLQQGGSIYDEQKHYCTLNTLTAVNSFIQWSQFYTKYNFAKQYSEINRFRTGEMPVVITDYTFYNSLSLAAPEIQALWDMACLPGTLREDGTVDRAVGGTVSGCAMFNNAENPQACWKFLKWWVSTQAQVSYGHEIEALQGSSARWPTANREAMQQLGWTTAVSNKILTQWEFVDGIPEVPGGYYVGRSVDNAIKSVINLGDDARETILDQVDKINKEIRNKRQEFGLE